MLKRKQTLQVILGVAITWVPAFSYAIAAKSIQSATTASSAERQRAIALYDQKKFAEALDLLLAVVKKNKEDHLAWSYLGYALVQQKKYKAASKAFETALKLRPDIALVHSGLAYSFLFRSKWSDAIRAADNALRLNPNLADAYYAIAVAHLRTDKQDEALQNADSAIKINPRFAAAYLVKSQALTTFRGDVLVADESESTEARRARFAQAAEALERYLELDPNSAEKLTWVEQVEALRFYSKPSSKNIGERTVFSGKDVHTKARVLSKPEPAYTNEARASGTMGRVVLRAIFSADGTVKHILVLKALPNGLTEASIRVARRIKFVPATVGGRSVSMFIQLEYNFHLF